MPWKFMTFPFSLQTPWLGQKCFSSYFPLLQYTKGFCGGLWLRGLPPQQTKNLALDTSVSNFTTNYGSNIILKTRKIAHNKVINTNDWQTYTIVDIWLRGNTKRVYLLIPAGSSIFKLDSKGLVIKCTCLFQVIY